MARLDVARGELWAHKSGDGVSARRRDPVWVAAADIGRGIGLNSLAFAFSRRGEDKGDAGSEAVNCAWAACATGDDEGE